MWHRKGEYCPEGTVPILRSSIENLPPKKPSTRRTSNYTNDLKSGNWFLYFQGELVGYWPAELFKNLNTSATLMEWGGEIINNKANGTHTGTQMGSGHFPTEGDGKAAYFTNLEYVDGGGLVNSATGVMSETSRSECYDIAVKDPDEKFGVYFLFGGPGLSIECYS
ncbi:hypothetical protein LINPERPRIM_LOCUS19262 [Linum perenne]